MHSANKKPKKNVIFKDNSFLYAIAKYPTAITTERKKSIKLMS